MNKEIELLSHIHENADMGQDSLEHILELSTDVEFSKAVRRQLDEYRNAYQISGTMLEQRGCTEEKDAPASGKMIANVMTKIKNKMDSSTSKLAEMVLQGSTMGVTQLTREIHDYDGKDREVLDFAKEQLRREEINVETMKYFL